MGVFEHFFSHLPLSFLSPSLWRTARYRLKYCLKGPLSLKQPTNQHWMIVGQGPIVLAVGAGGGCLNNFTFLYLISPLSPSLWETARYRLKYCLKGTLYPKQPTISGKIRKGNNCIITYERILVLAQCSFSHCPLPMHQVSFNPH